LLKDQKDCSKNSNCHSEQSEESHTFLFKSKDRKRGPSDFVLRMPRKDKFTKILERTQRSKEVVKEKVENVKKEKFTSKLKKNNNL
jgi:hypothetical protein